MPKRGIFNASLFPYDKYSVDKVWTKIYCHFYFRGITFSPCGVQEDILELSIQTIFTFA